jgi:hypothetical protein
MPLTDGTLLAEWRSVSVLFDRAVVVVLAFDRYGVCWGVADQAAGSAGYSFNGGVGVGVGVVY